MNPKLTVAVLVIAAVPVCAQAQSPSVPRVSRDDAQKVVTVISGDKAKTQTYCDVQKLGEQLEPAYEKRNLKLVDELLEKIEAMEKTLGPEYAALVDGLGPTRSKRQARCRDCVGIRSTQQAVYEVSPDQSQKSESTRRNARDNTDDAYKSTAKSAHQPMLFLALFGSWAAR
jgi:hypothetical protein